MRRLCHATFPIVTALLLTLTSIPVVTAEGPATSEAIVAGRVLLKLKPGTGASAFLSTVEAEDVRAVGSLPQLRYTVVSVPSGQESEWVRRFLSSPYVEAAQPEFTYRVMLDPKDFFYGLSRGDSILYQWNLRTINAPAAWDSTTGSAGHIIAIVDTGVDVRHEDLTGKVIASQDYVNEDNPFDGMGAHGTHVAGIAAAKTNNNAGMAAVSWAAKIISVKVADHFGKAQDTNAAQGIVFAADNGARIINLSFGGEEYSQLLQDAVDYAYSKGALIVAAAGNCADPIKLVQYDCKTLNAPIYPAAGRNVLAVGATGIDNQRAVFSEHGSYVAVSAPGEDILSTLPNQQYGRLWGTSMAAPHVSALANLIWAINPSLTNAQVADIMTSTARDLGPAGRDDEFGFGLIDAQAAVLKAQLAVTPPGIGFFVPISQTNTLTSTLTIASLKDTLSWTASVVPTSTAWLSIEPSSGTTPASPTISVNKGSMGAGRYDANVTIQVSGNQRASQTLAVPLVLANQIHTINIPVVMRSGAQGW